MPRTKKQRVLHASPKIFFFKPQGICLAHLEITNLEADEFEALKLHDVDKLSHDLAAEAMHISQPTFSRIIAQAHYKVSQALLLGQAIAIKDQKGVPHATTTQDTFKWLTHTRCDVCGNHCRT